MKILQKYKFVWLNTHYNHPNELCEDSCKALAKIAETGIPMGNQSVLLKGVNDNVDVMKALVHKLVKNRVRPYYIYINVIYPKVSAISAPLLPKELKLCRRGHTSGLCVPTYV